MLHTQIPLSLLRVKQISPFKGWLTEHHIVQRSAAETLDLPVGTFNRKLNGEIAWLDRDLRRINKVYGLSADFVLGLNKPRHEIEARGQGVDQQLNCPNAIQVNSTLSPLLAGGAK